MPAGAVFNNNSTKNKKNNTAPARWQQIFVLGGSARGNAGRFLEIPFF